MKIFTFARELIEDRTWYTRYYVKLPGGKLLWQSAHRARGHGADVVLSNPVGRRDRQLTIRSGRLVQLIEKERNDV